MRGQTLTKGPHMSKTDKRFPLGELTFVVLLVRVLCLQRALVSPLRPNVEPALSKFIIAHGCSEGSLFPLCPLLYPLTNFRVPVECHTRRMHVKRCAHSLVPLSK